VPEIEHRLVRAEDLPAVVTTLARAFVDDPLWGWWAFPQEQDRVLLLEDYWRPWVEVALKYDGYCMTPGAEAVAGWVPYGVAEVDSDGEAAIDASTRRLFGARTTLVNQVYDLFDAHRPDHLPHWYLTVVATNPDHRGKGLGMRLLADLLEQVDAENSSAYLESTNPVNDHRYERLGFKRYGEFRIPSGPKITTMWRPAQGG
jgi:GNAT superfamily N-acetyltransferase